MNKKLKPFIRNDFEFIYDDRDNTLAIINNNPPFANSKIGVFLGSQYLFTAILQDGIVEIPMNIEEYFYLYENQAKLEIIRR